MSLHKELHFEDAICDHLGAHGWLYETGAAAHYDRARALYPPDLVAWVQATQPDAWERLVRNHGASAGDALASRIREQLDTRGTLDLLRNGVELLGLKAPLKLAQFKPAFAINADLLARYDANRLRVVRQVRYSLAGEDCLDLVLLLNGIPVATAELKSDFTQRVDDAIDQYREDRLPRPKGGASEPLLGTPGGALVHFAVSHREVAMTTRLEGRATRFLPFNRGNEGGKGNPPNPDGYATAYLWEEVWERHGWLELLGRYLMGVKGRSGQVERVIFPRYHQLDVTRKLQAAIVADGAGGRYLIQHSAGSGKTNSIAWTAHFLSELHDTSQQKLFSSVLVVSDRTVIDAQLQQALFDFTRTVGVVTTVTGDGASKSQQLLEALSGQKKIVVCTIQTFPFALEVVRKEAARFGRRFAVIADEAHSSQTGESASKLKALLSAEEWRELQDGGEISNEDVLNAQMAARAAEDKAITFVAFTATPKGKTLELFGTRPDPARPPAPDNVPVPFHVYSMRQAIEEQFILDVLRNYTSYGVAYRLAHEGGEVDDREVERAKALKHLMGWVKLHPYNIAQKVELVVEHFRRHVAPLLGGTAKAMVVVASRVEAVRWKLAIERYVVAQRYAIGTLVAFSGEVDDPETPGGPFTESGAVMNPLLKGRDIREAFKGDGYQLLLVANKFQTGFDQPLLCGMYVDKRLAGIQAVQTLSRLNRAWPGKDTTYVLDFVNDPQEILTAFQTYYTTAMLETTTDPHLVYDLRAKLDAAGAYDAHEVERVVTVELNPKSTQRELTAAIEPVANRLMVRFRTAQQAQRQAEALGDAPALQAAKDAMEALVLFRRDLASYIRLYTFLAQIFDYGNTDLEKRAIFYKRLLPLLDFGREREGIDISKVQLTHHALKARGARDLVLDEGDVTMLPPITEVGGGLVQEKERARLREIIERVNTLFEGDLTDEDKLAYVNEVIKRKMVESPLLREQAGNNTKGQFSSSPDLPRSLDDAIIEAYDAHQAMSRQALESEAVKRGILDILLNHAGLYEALREAWLKEQPGAPGE